MKKRVLALCSVVCLLITCFPLTAFAATDDKEVRLPAISGQANIVKHSPENDVTRSGIKESSNQLNFSEDATVNYTYGLTYYEDDESKVGVDLTFTINDGDVTHSFTACGDVPRMELNDSATMLRGPLYGSFVDDGIEYGLSASFTKLEECDDVNIGLVITSADFTYQKMYSFGTFVMTDDIHSAWTNYRAHSIGAVNRESNASAELAAVASSDYAYIGSDYGAIGPTSMTTLTGDGNRLGGFVDNENKRVMLTLASYCDRFNSSSFINGTFVSAYVQDFMIELEQTSNACKIDGVRRFNLSVGSSTVDFDVVFSAASALLGLLPPPYNAGASFILDVFRDADEGSVNYVDRSDYQCLEVDGGTFSELYFDDAPFPIEFEIDNSSNTPKTFTGIASGSLTYVADVYITVFYIPTETAQLYISVTNVS